MFGINLLFIDYNPQNRDLESGEFKYKVQPGVHERIFWYNAQLPVYDFPFPDQIFNVAFD